MKVAIDVSPLSTGHKIRGVGSYLKQLTTALKKYHPENEYIDFNGIKNLPKNYDILHIPYFEPFLFSFSLNNKKNTIYTIHDLTPFVYPSLFPIGIKGKIAWNINKARIKNIGGIITDSYNSKKDIEKLINLESGKIKVVYLAADERFKKINDKKSLIKVKKKYNLPSEFVLYVGDVTQNKNLPNLIKAILKTEFTLICVGKALVDTNADLSNSWNKDLKEVRTLQEKNPNQIKFLGFVPDDELVVLYNLATIFTFPSLYEGFGLPVLEAMQSGLPVVASDKGSLKEIINDSALIIDPNSIENIAEGIKKLMRNKKLRETFIKKGFEQAKKFSWQKTSDETVVAYTKVYENL